MATATLYRTIVSAISQFWRKGKYRTVCNILSLYSRHHHHFRGVILSLYLTIAANVFVVCCHSNCSPGYLSQEAVEGRYTSLFNAIFFGAWFRASTVSLLSLLTAYKLYICSPVVTSWPIKSKFPRQSSV